MTALIVGTALGLAGLVLLAVAWTLARPAPTTVLGAPLDDAATPEALRLSWGYDPAVGEPVPMGRYRDGTVAFLTTPPPRPVPPLWVQFPPPGVVVHHIVPSGKSFAPWRNNTPPGVVISHDLSRMIVLSALLRLGHPCPGRRALPRGST